MRKIVKMFASTLVARHYSGRDAKRYEDGRMQSARWQFEDSSLASLFGLIDQKAEKIQVIDLPVGTNRFHMIFDSDPRIDCVHAADLSDDMLSVARSKNSSKYIFHKHDIIKDPFPFRAHTAICFRFVNLFDITTVKQIISNLASSVDSNIIISVRLTDAAPDRDAIVIQDKIYVHQKDAFFTILNDNGFSVEQNMEFRDQKPGIYHVLLLKRNRA